jgi:hypothetical protein
MPLYDITANTEIVCKQIFESASLHELNSQDVVIYMAIRTNYRLILNALSCIDDIKAGRINEQEQLAAYQWMIIQPFLSIDGFSVAFLSDVQLYELEKIANEFTDIMHQLETNNANTILQCEELAKQIQQDMVSILNPGSKRKVKKSDHVYMMQKIVCTGALIECGFLSNPEEEAKLRNSEYQKRLCAVIAASCSQHLSEE